MYKRRFSNEDTYDAMLLLQCSIACCSTASPSLVKIIQFTFIEIDVLAMRVCLLYKFDASLLTLQIAANNANDDDNNSNPLTRKLNLFTFSRTE